MIWESQDILETALWLWSTVFICDLSAFRYRAAGQQEQEVAWAVHQSERGNIQQLGQLAQEAVHPVSVRLRVQDGEGRGAAGGEQQQQQRQLSRRGQQEAG